LTVLEGKRTVRDPVSVWYWLLTVLAVALALSLFCTYRAVSRAEFPPLGGDVKNIIQMVQKHEDPTLFPRDFAFSDDSYRLYNPAFVQMTLLIHRGIGGDHYDISIQYLMFPICFVFIVSMSWLMWKITGRRWLSLFMALMATLSFETIFGNLTYSTGLYVTPRFLHLAIAPLLLGWLLFYGKSRLKGPLAFLVAGLSSNLHFTSGAGLAVSFLLAWVLYDFIENPTRRKLFHWSLCGLLTALGAVPYLLTFLAGQVVGGGEASNISPTAFNNMLNTRLAFYPIDVFAKQMGWPDRAVQFTTGFLLVYPLIVGLNLILRKKGRSRAAYFLLYFTNLAFMTVVCADEAPEILIPMLVPAIALGFFDLLFLRTIDEVRFLLAYFVSGVAALGVLFSLYTVFVVKALDLFMPSFYYDFGAAVKYVPLILNLYGAMMLSQTIMSVGQLLESKKGKGDRFIGAEKAVLPGGKGMGLTLGVLLIAGLCVCFGYRCWHTPYNGLASYWSDIKSIVRGRAISSPSAVELHYREAASWIKSNTPKDALFVVLVKEPPHDFMFRYKTQRSMWVCFKDGGISFYKGRDSFVRWYLEHKAREEAIATRDPAKVIDFATSRGVDYLFVDRKNYRWMDRPGPECVFENESFRVCKIGEGRGAILTSFCKNTGQQAVPAGVKFTRTTW
jgi:hypothetical protein